jgi:GT2 family glycosyltransferase
MKVTAIIPSLYKNKDYLKLCVQSLRKSRPDWDIVVVTNGGEMMPLDIPEITMRLHTRDQGQCKAVNIGIQAANPATDYWFIVNDDMYFAPDWDKNIRWDRPVWSPNLLEPTTGPGSAPPFYTMDGGFTLDDFKKKQVDAEVKKLVNEFTNNEETGFNFPLFIRKDVWSTIEGYDEEYDPWGSNSDTDLQAKIHLAGIQTMRQRGVVVYHFSNKSGTFDGTHQAEWQHNFDYFTDKFGFNRDTVEGCDVWYSKNILPPDPDNIEYRPHWMGKYGKL